MHADAVHVISDPTDVSRPTGNEQTPALSRRALLRREVGRLRERESRRVFDASLHVGVLGGDRTGFVLRAADRPAMDAGLLLDVASRLVEDSAPAWCTAWLVRSGVPDRHDLDLQALAAFRAAFAIHGREPDGCYALTRTGWRDLVTDEKRIWSRLRL